MTQQGTSTLADSGSSSRASPAGITTTLAGLSESRATQAISRQNVAVDTFRTVYTANDWKSQVVKMDSSGTITITAGTGVSDFTGDGQTATSAEINLALAVAAGPSGALYIADTYDNVIRMVRWITRKSESSC